MKKGGHDAAESVLKELDENHQKYKFMELNLLSRKKRQASVMISIFLFYIITTVLIPIAV